MPLDNPYMKAILALLVSAGGAIVQALAFTSSGDIGDVDAQHWLIALAFVLASGGLVYLVSNIQGVWGGVAKAVLALLSSGIASLVIALDDNLISQTEWITAFSAAILATGLVYEAAGPLHPVLDPNAPDESSPPEGTTLTTRSTATRKAPAR